MCDKREAEELPVRPRRPASTGQLTGGALFHSLYVIFRLPVDLSPKVTMDRSFFFTRMLQLFYIFLKWEPAFSVMKPLLFIATFIIQSLWNKIMMHMNTMKHHTVPTIFHVSKLID